MKTRIVQFLFLALALPLASFHASARGQEGRPPAAETGTCDLQAPESIDALDAMEPEAVRGCMTLCSACERGGGVCVFVPSGCICA
jgi:hypothetical protein